MSDSWFASLGSIDLTSEASEASDGDRNAAAVSRRIGKWCSITALFALVPVLFDVIILLSRAHPVTMDSLFSDSSSSYLIGFAICATGFGDTLFDQRTRGLLDGLTISALVISTLILTIGALLYASFKDRPDEYGWAMPVMYIAAAAFVSFASTLVSARSVEMG